MVSRRAWGALRPPTVAAVGGGYTGPGDIIASARGWWGLRAFSDATTGDPAVNLTRSSDSSSQDIVTLSDGSLNVADSFFNGSTYLVNTLYDQSGAAAYGNMIASGLARPVFSLGGLNGLPILTFSTTTHLAATSAPASQAQPFLYSFVAADPLVVHLIGSYR